MSCLQTIQDHVIIRDTVGYEAISKIDVMDMPKVMEFLKVVNNYIKMSKLTWKMRRCSNTYNKFNFDDFFNKILTYIEEGDLKSKLIKLKNEKRIVYVENCGEYSYFDKDGIAHGVEPLILPNGEKITQKRKEYQPNLRIQYYPGGGCGEEKTILIAINYE